ncbi:uncharacterized protein [Medicago truncatula]|uniref:Transmembrane protein, putative n=1 Tax=Medicago truncatula TaxID=3880 RepID=A0A072UQU2_MEDTR|nr:uncharacterized protein LOC11432091 isoform X2 [Medicago truncatula]KEH28230.1 transmembrane protein, putative [Medicago truncatula]
MAEKENGVTVEQESFNKKKIYDVVQSLILEPCDTANRIKTSLSPYIPEASRNYTRRVLRWSRQGSSLRPLLLISVGTIALVALTGLLTFMLLLLVATINAIIVSLFISLAVAGGFLALFFALVTAIYIGALSVAIFAISTVVFWTTVAILITAGNLGPLLVYRCSHIRGSVVALTIT